MLKASPRSTVLVFVTDQPECGRLIEAGARLANRYAVPLQVLSILPTGPMSEYTAARLQVLYDLSGKLGADMTVLFADSPVLTAAVYARKHHAIHIVSGSPGRGGGVFIEGVRSLCPSVPWSVLDESQKLITFPPITVLT